jgi:hypothetical protein
MQSRSYSPKRDLAVIGVIIIFLAIIIIVGLYTSSTVFWYSQIVLQLIMAGIALWIAFGGGER